MAAHVHHESLAGYSPERVLQDGCPECEQRGRELRFEQLDSRNFARLWQRAYQWNTSHDVVPSEAEAPMLEVLWKVMPRMQEIQLWAGIYGACLKAQADAGSPLAQNRLDVPSVGARVRCTQHHHNGCTGEVIGFDQDLDMVLIEWSPADTKSWQEACEPHEYELVDGDVLFRSDELTVTEHGSDRFAITLTGASSSSTSLSVGEINRLNTVLDTWLEDHSRGAGSEQFIPCDNCGAYPANYPLDGIPYCRSCAWAENQNQQPACDPDSEPPGAGHGPREWG